jgi:hypothetical protein
MTVSYNRNTGVWTVNGRGAYATEDEARTADTAGGGAITYDDSDIYPGGSYGGSTSAQAATPPPAAGPSQTPTTPRPNDGKRYQWTGYGWTEVSAQQAYDRGNIGGAGGAYNAGNDQTRAAFDATHRANQGGVDWGKVGNTARDVGGFFLDPIGGFFSRGQAATASAAAPAPVSGGPGRASLGTSDRTNAATAETQGAERQFQNEQERNAAENDSLFTGAMDRFDNLDGGDYGMSDESRAYQQEGLAQQRMLLERLLDFDTSEYASRFADQALSRQIALGRQGTSAASQQAGMFAAMDQAPALYAEGARQANALEAQRLGQAQQAAASFGELGTMTRGQDEGRAQFEAKLPLEIANSVASLTQGKMNLNQQESQMFADIWSDFARLQSVYAGMSSAEQIAWWNEETARRGQDKQFEAIKAQIKANGAVTDKDVINGLFQLGGGLLGIGGQIAGA